MFGALKDEFALFLLDQNTAFPQDSQVNGSLGQDTCRELPQRRETQNTGQGIREA
jgi:hypothetical protein